MAGSRRSLPAIVAPVAVLVAVLAGCGGGDDSADMETTTTVAPTEPSTTTTEAPSTTQASPEDVIDVPVSDELFALVPDFGPEVRRSADPRFDIRRCDGQPFSALPAAQAEAEFSGLDEELTVGVYGVADGAAPYFLDDYLDSLLVCSGGEVFEEQPLGELAYTVPFDSDTSNGTITLVWAADVVWVVQKRTPEGPAELTNDQLQALFETTG